MKRPLTFNFSAEARQNRVFTHLISGDMKLDSRTSLAFISFTYFLGLGLALDDLRLDGQLVAGQTERLTRDFFGNTGDLKHDTAGLDNCYPILRRALTGTHTGLGRLLADSITGGGKTQPWPSVLEKSHSSPPLFSTKTGEFPLPFH